MPASAIPVQFLEVGPPLPTPTPPTGFSSTNFPMPIDIPIPLDADVRPAGTGVGANGFELSLNLCILINESPGSGCQSVQPTGSTGYTQIVEITLVRAPDDAPDTGSLIFFSGMPAIPTYSLADVSFIVDPDPIGGYTFTPFTTASFTPTPSMTYYYLGFILTEGQTATFRVDVAGDHSMAGTDLVFAANAYLVPEPSTALLVGTGLLLLARRRSR
jgi:hypothetical protein